MSAKHTPYIVAGVVVAAVGVVAVVAGASKRPTAPTELWLRQDTEPQPFPLLADAPGGPPAEYAFVMRDTDAGGAITGLWFTARGSGLGKTLRHVVHGSGVDVADAAHFARTDETRDVVGVTWRRFAPDGAVMK